MAARLLAHVALITSLALAAPAAVGSGQTAPTGQDREQALLRRLLSEPEEQPGDTVAQFGDARLSRQTLTEFLVHTRGLDALLNLMQLRIAQEMAEQRGIPVTPEHIEEEKRTTLRQAFGGMAEIKEEQYDELLTQLLAQQQLSRAEFDVVIATNAYLKALARPSIDQALTEEALRQAFNIRYGEQVRVRHIQLDNLAQVAEVRKRLEAGDDFARVAADVSRNTETRPLGGLFPPFSLQSELPEPFKQTAFALQPGQISDPVEAGGAYHLLRLEERIPPRAVQYEDVREELKETVAQEQLLLATTQLRRIVAQSLASEELKVHDTVLAEQLRRRLEAIRPQPIDQEEMKRQMEQQRPAGPATQPAEGAGS